MTTTAQGARHPLQDWVPETRTLLIDGQPTQPQGETWDVVNPATERIIATVGGASVAQVDDAVAAARGAFPAWAALSGEERSRHIHRLADALEKAADRLLPSIVNEVGTPVSLASYLQVKMAVDEHLRWAAEAAKVDRTVHLGGYDKPHPTESDVVYEPVGVVAAITGYNYPLNLAIFKFGAALAAGCTVVLLPSPRTPLTTLFLGDLIQEAGLPPGVMNVIIGGADVGQRLSAHPGVDRVSFTGSDAVGARIMAQAADNLTGVTLELGG
jgi:aldehyde dehydrogenase (NAD+)/betaine-aldehyde dehydrogenase